MDYTDDILRVVNFYTDHGLEIVGGLLRHGINDRHSLYVKGPSCSITELLPGVTLILYRIRNQYGDTKVEENRWLYYWGDGKEALWYGNPIPANRVSDKLKEIVRQKLGSKI
ncbi:VOC family protein [Saccharolobus shibatae]|uniref:Catechol 2,3-dioxygenase n=1 Tax=Saccharolobus shibatae TaxID=2286 RepID=A0A8F5C1N6_9CREN|nr:hypothetical protein [Saccharolobus shibatae]QXJ35433.1 Catechol 2,3-dioxygenase [Saccharolobus shibatae]